MLSEANKMRSTMFPKVFHNFVEFFVVSFSFVCDSTKLMSSSDSPNWVLKFYKKNWIEKWFIKLIFKKLGNLSVKLPKPQDVSLKIVCQLDCCPCMWWFFQPSSVFVFRMTTFLERESCWLSRLLLSSMNPGKIPLERMRTLKLVGNFDHKNVWIGQRLLIAITLKCFDLKKILDKIDENNNRSCLWN